MKVFHFSFKFANMACNASCHIIYPPPDKQYHVSILNAEVAAQYGDFHIIVLIGEELHWGIPPHQGGSDFMKAVVTGLKNHPDYE